LEELEELEELEDPGKRSAATAPEAQAAAS